MVQPERPASAGGDSKVSLPSWDSVDSVVIATLLQHQLRIIQEWLRKACAVAQTSPNLPAGPDFKQLDSGVSGVGPPSPLPPHNRTHVLSSYLQCLTFRPLLLTVSWIRVFSSLCNCNWVSSAQFFSSKSKSSPRCYSSESAEAGVLLFHYARTAAHAQMSSEPPLAPLCDLNNLLFFLSSLVSVANHWIKKCLGLGHSFTTIFC